LARRLDLSQRQPRMIEKDPTRGSQGDAACAAGHKLDANLELRITDLSA
jgi:hypothetical protein